MNIFVGNLASSVTADDLRELFSGYGYGTVINAVVMKDTASDQSLGYGHVYLIPDAAAHQAIVGLHHTVLKGKAIAVRECVYREGLERRVNPFPWKGAERRNDNLRRHRAPEQTTTLSQGAR